MRIGNVLYNSTTTYSRSSGAFYTDSNGRQTMRRTRNHRPTWTLNVTEPVSGNYYPVNSRASVAGEEDGTLLTVLTDRSQGGTSMRDGELELMLHRRLLYDDAFGVGEALNETAYGQGLVARGKHWVQLAPGGEGAAREYRLGAQQRFMDAVTSFSPANGLTFQQWKDRYPMRGSMLFAELPESVHLLTAEEWHGNSRDSVLLRFEHLFEPGEDHDLSQAVEFDLDKVFADYRVEAAEEVMLGANLRLGERRRFDWSVEESNDVGEDQAVEGEGPAEPLSGSKVVKLYPMQIRTFIVDLERRVADDAAERQ